MIRSSWKSRARSPRGLHTRKPQNCAAVIGNPLNETNYANNVKCIPIPPPPPKYTVNKTPPKSCFIWDQGKHPARRAVDRANRGGNFYYCKFTVAVTNVSGAAFVDTPGAPARIVHIEPGGTPLSNWQCTDSTYATSMTCTLTADPNLPAGAPAEIIVDVAIPRSSVTTGMVENCASPGTAAPNSGVGQVGNPLSGSKIQTLSNQLPQGQQSGASNQLPQGQQSGASNQLSQGSPGLLSGLDPSLPQQQGVGSKPGTGLTPSETGR